MHMSEPVGTPEVECGFCDTVLKRLKAKRRKAVLNRIDLQCKLFENVAAQMVGGQAIKDRSESHIRGRDSRCNVAFAGFARRLPFEIQTSGGVLVRGDLFIA